MQQDSFQIFDDKSSSAAIYISRPIMWPLHVWFAFNCVLSSDMRDACDKRNLLTFEGR
jgi:hypothetical protein